MRESSSFIGYRDKVRSGNQDARQRPEMGMALNLRTLRVQNGITLEQLAINSGLTRSYLSKIERGISTPSIESALRIAEALGVSVDRLFGKGAEDEAISIVRADSDADAEANHLSLVAGLNPNRIMRAFIVRPGRAAARGRLMSHHEGEEILFIISGTIQMQIGKRVETLKPGDCVQFDSTLPHKLTALSDEPASALVVIASESEH